MNKPNKNSLTARVIKTDSMSSFMGYLPNPDEVLRDSGEAISIYREMKADGRVKSLLKLSRSKVSAIPVYLEKGESADKVDTFVREALKTNPLGKLIRRLLSAMDYGFSVVEIVWMDDKGWWKPLDQVLRKPERFAFDQEGNLKLKNQTGVQDLSQEAYKFLIYRHDKEAENPYGTSILKAAFWPWKFKKAGLGFWLAAAEKFAVPSILALFDSTDTEEKVQERASLLSQMLSTVSSGSSASLANVRDVRVLEASGNLSEFRALMDWCDTQISYAITGQTLATGESEFGTRAQGEVHEDTMEDSIQAVIPDLTEVLQRFIDWIVELNFGPGNPSPQVRFDTNSYANWEMVRDALDRGVPVSKSALYNRYGLPEPDGEDDVFIKPSNMGLDSGLMLADTTPGKKKLRRPMMLG